jgi:hypothetical protein
MKHVAILFLFSLCVTSSYADTDTFQSFLDRKSIAFNETVQLILSSNDTNIPQSPDLSPLYKDFTIVGTQQSTQISSINNQSAALTRWIVTLMPKHNGQIQIPSIQLGTHKSQPLMLHVKNTTLTDQTDNSIRLVAQATPEKPVEKSQIIYIVRLFYDKNIHNGDFTEPSIKNVEIIHLDRDRTYEELLDGHLYSVLEKRYAIFPEKPGALTIPGVIFTGNILQSEKNASQNNPFISAYWKTIRLQANAVNLQVQPPPANIKLGMWLPAQQFNLSESWSEPPEHFTVGEPITRTLTMTAEGLTADQLPSLERFQPKGFKIYLDKPILKNTTDGKTIMSQRIEKYALIPQTAGEITLPKIKLHWWNTATKKMQSAHIAEKTVEINAAPASSQDSTQPSRTVQKASNSHWFFLSLGLFIIWLATVFLWWFKNKLSQKNRLTHQLKTHVDTIATIKKKIKQACYANNLQECKDGLLAWGNLLWPNQEIRNLGDIRKILQDDAGKEILCTVDKYLYTVDTETQWEGKKSWKIIEKLLSNKKKREKNTNQNTLPPLHPSHEETS